MKGLTQRCFFALLAAGALTASVTAEPFISEFVAKNDAGFVDGDGETSDWIEIHNPDPQAIDLAGFHLTDDPTILTRWKFPTEGSSIGAGGYLVVFASNKATQPGSDLHAGFRLSGGGEFLALVAPDGKTVVDSFAPIFPQQYADISYGRGVGGSVSRETFVAIGSDAAYFVPSEELAADWRLPDFDDSQWLSAKTGLGFGYPNQPIGENGDLRSAMRGKNASVFIRIPFQVDDPASVSTLNLRMKYEDGFVAYLNGKVVAAENAPDALTFDVEATDSREVDDGDDFESFALDTGEALVAGKNVLAIHGLNDSRLNSDFLLVPELVGIVSAAAEGRKPGYFTIPTPGEPNVGGLADPKIEVTFDPPSGTFSGALEFTLGSKAPGATIFYTTDGSDPDQSATTYKTPITISKTTQVRARVLVPGDAEPTPVVSASYVGLAEDVRDFSSPLPIVILENLGARSIPDKRAHNPPAGDGGGIRQVPRQPAFMAIIARGDDGRARMGDAPATSSRIGIRVRGSSSASQPAKKENYSIETWSARNGDQVDIAPLGLPPENDWVLYAPYNYDRALIRNAFVYETSRLMGHYASRTRFVEVFVNTEGDDLSMADFAGLFVFMEKIKRSPDRVAIDNFSADGTTGGWLLESNRKDPLPEDGSNTKPFNFHTAGPNRRLQGPYGGSSGADRGGDDIPTGYNTFLNFVEPTGYKTTEAQRKSIISWFDRFEEALYGDSWRRTDIGFRAFIDVESFIDHYLITNWTRNVDGMQLSTFMYRPVTDGKLHLNPVWDFDRSMESYDGRDDSTSGMWGQNFLWFRNFFRDPEFEQQWIDRWQELRRGILSTERVDARIDAMAAEITEPVAEANFARWRSNNRPRRGGWPAEIDHLKSWLKRRSEWIDGRFLSPPEFNQDGGAVPDGFELTMTSGDDGTLYFTRDGSDPRLPDLPGAEVEIIGESVPARGFVPNDESLGATWRGDNEPFEDSEWLGGNTGIGFQYPGLTGIDSSAMKGVTASAYLRVPFDIDDATLETLGGVRLDMKYDDGFVAWINGVEVASANRPDTLAWNSRATKSNPDSRAEVFEPFDVSQFLTALKPGTNLLAIQLLNSSPGGSDALALPRLIGNTGSFGGVAPAAERYIDPVTLDATTTVVTARLEKEGEWSGPVRASFMISSVNEVDRDRDGIPALVELGLGTSDNDPASGHDRILISASGIRFRHDPTAVGVLIGLEYSTDLIQWRMAKQANPELLLRIRTEHPDGTETLVWEFRPDASRQLYLRLSAEESP